MSQDCFLSSRGLKRQRALGSNPRAEDCRVLPWMNSRTFRRVRSVFSSARRGQHRLMLRYVMRIVGFWVQSLALDGRPSPRQVSAHHLLRSEGTEPFARDVQDRLVMGGPRGKGTRKKASEILLRWQPSSRKHQNTETALCPEAGLCTPTSLSAVCF